MRGVRNVRDARTRVHERTRTTCALNVYALPGPGAPPGGGGGGGTGLDTGIPIYPPMIATSQSWDVDQSSASAPAPGALMIMLTLQLQLHAHAARGCADYSILRVYS